MIKTMKEKFESTKPYNIFYNKIPKSEHTLNKNNCISFSDLFCPSLGVLKKSLQLNFYVDMVWLHDQYEIHGLGDKPLTVFYGYDMPNVEEYKNMNLENVEDYFVKPKNPKGIHHSKISIFLYEDDSIRVVVSTANLYYEDWNHYNQTLWMSPSCPKMHKSILSMKCGGPTGFKLNLMQYLKSYKLSAIDEWINVVKRADFTDVKVCLVASIPGYRFTCNFGSHLLMVARLLKAYCNLPDEELWAIIAQSSSIGSFGTRSNVWLEKTLIRCLASHKSFSSATSPKVSFSIVYPTKECVLDSYFGEEGAGCLPYSEKVHKKQRWVKNYLHQWKADEKGRTRAMPHLKTYCRISSCGKKLAWFLLTSANISQSAWGFTKNIDERVSNISYEAGVMFLPCFFDKEYFDVSDESDKIQLMYDFPLTAYTVDEQPWYT